MRRSSRFSIILNRTVDSRGICPFRVSDFSLWLQNRCAEHIQCSRVGTGLLCWIPLLSTPPHMSSSGWPSFPRENVRRVNVRSSAVCISHSICGRFLTCADDYWNSGYGRIIMVPRVKLAYDKVSYSSHRALPTDPSAESLRYHPPRQA